VRPAGPAETARKQLARDLVGEIRDADRRLRTLRAQLAGTVAEHGSRLPEIDGIGPVIAGRLLGRTRHASRFPSAPAFASYAGVAPVEVASAGRARHRRPRGGDRQLNLALYFTALTQVACAPAPAAPTTTPRSRSAKTHNEAMRRLKRRLADHVWRTMIPTSAKTQQRAREDLRGDSEIQRGRPNPATSSSDKSLPGPADRNSMATPERAA
jgi:transposase